jgi:uncharacterized integral membrane protein (TIGR00698 family)
MTALSIGGLPGRARVLFPGVLACGVVAAAATFLSQHYGAPVMLFALLLGMAMNFLSSDGPCAPGIGFTGREVLRVGVALLGLRITSDQVTALGWFPPLLVVGTVVLTIIVSVIAARLFGFKGLFGLLTGGATAICGASAALALAAALPNHPLKERATLFTVIGVSTLSTVAMIAYPMIVRAFDLDPLQAGIFLGGTIHDVAQVVGAGYSMSRETGDSATLVKLMRVTMLLPVILVAVTITRLGIGGIEGSGNTPGAARPPLLPWFAVAFAVLVVINSLGWIPQPLIALGNDVSRWCLVAAIAGIGMKTHLRELSTVGIKPIVLMVGETIFLAVLVLLLLRWAQ